MNPSGSRYGGMPRNTLVADENFLIFTRSQRAEGQDIGVVADVLRRLIPLAW